MEQLLTPDEILQLVKTGMVELTDALMIRLKYNSFTESYEEEDWYNDPNSVMSRWHY